MPRNQIRLATALLLVGAGTLVAQRPNFSGNWVANLEQSNFGTLVSPKRYVRTIRQQDPYLTIATQLLETSGEKRGELRFTTDGEESDNEVAGLKVKGYARRIGSHILIHTSRVQNGMEMTIDELWTLSADGQALTIDAAVSTPAGKQDLKVVFRKR